MTCDDVLIVWLCVNNAFRFKCYVHHYFIDCLISLSLLCLSLYHCSEKNSLSFACSVINHPSPASGIVDCFMTKLLCFGSNTVTTSSFCVSGTLAFFPSSWSTFLNCIGFLPFTGFDGGTFGGDDEDTDPDPTDIGLVCFPFLADAQCNNLSILNDK